MQERYPTQIPELTAARGRLPHDDGRPRKAAEEGGCGVTGFIASVPVRGRHIYEPSFQMNNRGNGKGGGIAAVGLCAADLGVSQAVLDSHYMLQVALLEPEARAEVEKRFIAPHFDVHQASQLPTVDDYRDIEGLAVRPPDVLRYFVRVKPAALERFMATHGLQQMDPARVEDEFVHQNSTRLNQALYASMGKQRAFVLSHGRNMMILKIVGFAEKVVQYYCLEDFKAHGWIAHQRYPTKGRVWHPGGAHPFCGMDEALVHNGDFANYHAVSEYLRQYNIFPQFLTDTEVSVLLFDLWRRTFNYPLEYIIEAMAPTTEHDFDRLPPEKQKIYRYLQSAHIQASPDGPWFFIIARNDPYADLLQLIGITDTSMLRPQVFALQDGEVQIGLICSEKQAIDATLQNLAAEDPRFCPVADKYWNARGGSASDGGAFMFTVRDAGRGDGSKTLACTNKFGEPVTVPRDQHPERVTPAVTLPPGATAATAAAIAKGLTDDVAGLKTFCRDRMASWSYAELRDLCAQVRAAARAGDAAAFAAVDVLTDLNDRRFATGAKKRSAVLRIVRETLTQLFRSAPPIGRKAGRAWAFIDRATRAALRPPQGAETLLVLDAHGFEPEGEDCDAQLIRRAYEAGWRRFICFGYRGQRFTGCGLGRDTGDVRIDVYDSSGDYLASGIDGMALYVHGNAQDQLGQIMKDGKLVIFGDVGQTFMYGAKGGEVYVLGNAAGRPLINAVGRPRVVINGSCLDYLAESFMAGDPLGGGGFVILNGVAFDDYGRLYPLDDPYPGANLFSLASGGAIYLRDPHRRVVEGQLNGAVFEALAAEDWALMQPYLEENERLFGISIERDLLTVDGRRRPYTEVYRKVRPLNGGARPHATAAEEYGQDWRAEIPATAL